MSRSLLDRMLAPVKPRPIAGFRPPVKELDTGLWRLERRLRLPGGLVLPVAMTIVRLPDGKLLLHSPVRIDEDVTATLTRLGEVSVLLAPNSFHYVFVAEYVTRFPAADLFVAPGLRERAPSLPAASEVVGTPAGAWPSAVESIVFGPVGSFSEVVLFDRSTSTLVLTDLAFNMTRFDNAFDRIAWRLFGVPPRFGPSRTGRLTLLRDRAAAGPLLRTIAARDFRRILVAHGDPVEADARGEFERAFRRYL